MKKYVIDKKDKQAIRTQVGQQVDRTKKSFNINELDGGEHWLKTYAKQQARERTREQVKAFMEKKRQA